MAKVEQWLPDGSIKLKHPVYIQRGGYSRFFPMDPSYKPSTVNAPAVSRVPHSALVVDVTSASTASGNQGDSVDICSRKPHDPHSSHANDCVSLVWFSLLHTALSILTSGRQCECTGRTPSNAYCECRHSHRHRGTIWTFLLGSVNLFSCDTCHPRTCSLTPPRNNSECVSLSFLDRRTNGGSERNITGSLNIIHSFLLPRPLHH